MVRTVLTNQANVNNLVFYIEATTADEYASVLQGTYDGTLTAVSAHWNFDLKDGAGIPGWNGLSINRVPIVPVTQAPSGKIMLVDHETTFVVGLRGSMWDINEDWKTMESSTTEWNRIHLFAQLVSVNPRRGYIKTAA